MLQLIKSHSGPSSDHKLFNSHYGTPCTFNAEEHGDGHHNVEGSYSVALPDGRIPYGGYVADVSYEGPAHYEPHQPAYHPPAPAYHQI